MNTVYIFYEESGRTLTGLLSKCFLWERAQRKNLEKGETVQTVQTAP